ncbi:MAG: hypothetical protein IKR08_07815, partial [Firmicutes bacterium]|nr:hypothetical protein [Bacillota bacterium]
FCKSVGLPVCTADLGLTDETRDAALNALVDAVYGKRWNVSNEPFFFTRQVLLDAFYYLDQYAEEHK